MVLFVPKLKLLQDKKAGSTVPYSTIGNIRNQSLETERATDHWLMLMC